MQRSRRDLLQRRALEEAIGINRLFKVSLSLVVVLWGLVFLLNLWISHGDGQTDVEGGGSKVLPFNESTFEDTKLANTWVLGSDAGHETEQSCTR